MGVLTHSRASALAHSVLQEAEKDGGKPVAVVVMGLDRKVLRLDCMDGVKPASSKIVLAKAETALEWERDTIDFGDWEQRDLAAAAAAYPGFMNWGGGIVLYIGDEIVGAMAVSGRTERQDHDLAFLTALRHGFRPEGLSVGRVAVAGLASETTRDIVSDEPDYYPGLR